MKNRFLLPLCLALAVGCQEEGESIKEDCYLSEITASNSETFKFIMQDGKIVQTAYGDVVSDAVYNYDSEGKLKVVEFAEGSEIRYSYNQNDKLILAETFDGAEVISTVEYQYDNNGFPVRSVSTHDINDGVQHIIETDIEYQGGNPVKRTSYLRTSEDPEKRPLAVVTIKYDNKLNPYNTHNSSVAEPMVNNPLEYNYEDDPESKTVITYTYNELGYPVTYNRHHPNRTDNYPDVNGTFVYSCPNG